MCACECGVSGGVNVHTSASLQCSLVHMNTHTHDHISRGFTRRMRNMRVGFGDIDEYLQ